MRLEAAFHEDCRPSVEEGLLLRAALLPPHRARGPWDAWLQDARKPTTIGQMRLLPAVFKNLHKTAAVDDGLRLSEVEYFRARSRNLILFEGVAPFLRALADREISFTLLKGSALVAAYSMDPGLRPMSDLDVLVRPRDVERTLDVLNAQGYSSPVFATAGMRDHVHAQAFAQDGRAPLDLHWRSLADGSDDDEAFWEGTEEATLASVRVRVPSAADLLLNACIQGTRWEWDAPQRWVLDAMTILRSTNRPIDWSRVLRRSAEERRTLNAHDALCFLRDEFEADVPPEITASLARVRVATSERLAAQAWRVRPDLRGPRLAWAMRWDAYQRLKRRGLAHGVSGLVEAWRRSWDLDHWWQLPHQALVRGTRRSWQLLRHRLRE